MKVVAEQGAEEKEEHLEVAGKGAEVLEAARRAVAT